MKKIAIVSATRAEYGILVPLIRAVHEDSALELRLIVTGTHLSMQYGYTVEEIEKDGFPVAHRIPILEDGNTPYDISLTMANAIKKFAGCFRDDRPDLLVLLGDRTEMLAIACAAMNERIPIAHIHGGEITEGAVDDCVRHALTKMSYLHFAAAEAYRRRIIQMGEAPERVYNVGSLGTENIMRLSLMQEEEIRKITGIPSNLPYVVVTYHPVTLEEDTVKKQADALCGVMAERKDLFFLITMANADVGGRMINQAMSEYAEEHENARFVRNLGMFRYLSAVKHALLVLGNSSSGVLEAPVLGTPTVNIGDRQKGRLMADTVVCCACEKQEIDSAMRKVEKMEKHPVLLFGDGNTSGKMIFIIKETLQKGIDLKKGFLDCCGDSFSNVIE